MLTLKSQSTAVACDHQHQVSSLVARSLCPCSDTNLAAVQILAHVSAKLEHERQIQNKLQVRQMRISHQKTCLSSKDLACGAAASCG